MSDNVVLNIRGTSGSGKSTIVRTVMALYKTKLNVKVEGRKQPMGYLLQNPGHRMLAVLGHYETACGGCDTIKFMDDTMARVTQAYRAGYDVLFEGVLLSAEVNRFIALHEAGVPVQTLYLNTPIDVCIDSINERRKAKSGENASPVDPTITTNRLRSILNGRKRLDAAGVPAFEGSRDEVLAEIKRQLNV